MFGRLLTQLQDEEAPRIRDTTVHRLRGNFHWWTTEVVRMDEYGTLGRRPILQCKPRDVDIPLSLEDGFVPDFVLRRRLVEALGVKDVTPLFDAAGVKISRPHIHPIVLHEGLETYPLESIPENNWIFSAFKGFQELRRKLDLEGSQYTDFATVGTGSGLDVIGAEYILRLGQWHATEINPRALENARHNLENHLQPNDYWWDTRAHFHHGSLADPLIEKGIKVDILYANLPNLPVDDVKFEGSTDSASYIDRSLVAGCPKDLDDYLLATQFHILKQGRQCLHPQGSVVIALGGRMPYEVVQTMFEISGYQLQDLYGRLKIQTQPQYMIAGYAKAEEKNGVQFSFYDLDLPVFSQMDIGFGEGVSIKQKEADFAPYAISAREALMRHQAGRKIGHAVWILRGILQ